MAAVIACLVFACAMAVSGCKPGGNTPCAELTLGTVVGNEVPVGAGGRVFEFLGMRYASANTARWSPAQPAEPWTGDYNATSFGSFCPQLGEGPIPLGSEDCLFINVWTNNLPGVNAGAPAPVFLWTYGGSFLTGGASFPYYNGANLVKSHENFVVVTFDYRVGPLGLLALPSLSTTMLFMEDQRLAYEWVSQHIHAFGGDLARVTLVGQSAGGDSVCLHSFSPLSQGLFRSLIIESGDCTQWNRPLSEALALGRQYAAALGCAQTNATLQAACMRSKSLIELFNTSTAMGGNSYINFNSPPMPPPWEPWIDGFNIVEPPMVTLATDRWNPVPVLIGTTADEFGLVIWLMGLLKIYPTPSAAISGPLQQFVNEYAQQSQDNDWPSSGIRLSPSPGAQAAAGASIMAQYKSATSSLDILVQAGSAFIHQCGTRRLARGFAAVTREIYFYLWQHHPSTPSPEFGCPLYTGAYHFSEVPFVFGNPTCLLIPDCVPSFTPEEALLSARLGAYWVNFVRSGASPNTGLPVGSQLWPSYSLKQDQVLGLNLTDAVITGALKTVCQPWDEIMMGTAWPVSTAPAAAPGAPAASSSDDSSVGKAVGISFALSVVVAVVVVLLHTYLVSRKAQVSQYRLYEGD
jgi:para-nitrobenzyl esterase